MDELVGRASDAYMNAYGDTSRTFGEKHLKGMTAAAKVLLEAALGEPTHEEFVEVFGQDFMALPNTKRKICKVIANRKARLLAPKTIESRIAEHLDAFLPLETFQARDNAIKRNLLANSWA